MLDFDYFYRQWVGSGGESDHHLVFFQILNGGAKLKTPFKFNPHWLENENLVNTLKASWVVYDDQLLESPASQFVSNLKRIKEVSVAWSVKKKESEFKDLVEIEIMLSVFSHKFGFGFSSVEDKEALIILESRKRKILLEQEHEARQ